MDWEGKIGAPQPVCAASGRTLLPGEAVFGVLVQREGRFERLDIAAEAWPGYDRGPALSWWRRTVPEPERRPGRIRLDPAALARIFADLDGAEDPAKQAFRYVVALCLTRARRLHLERIDHDPDGTAWLVLHERGAGRHRIRDPGLKAEDEAGLTEQLVAVAAGGGEAAPSG